MTKLLCCKRNWKLSAVVILLLPVLGSQPVFAKEENRAAFAALNEALADADNRCKLMVDKHRISHIPVL